MAVNEAGRRGPAREIDDSGLMSGEPGIFGIAADGAETTGRYGHRLFNPEKIIYGQNGATGKNQIEGVSPVHVNPPPKEMFRRIEAARRLTIKISLMSDGTVDHPGRLGK